MVLLVDDLMTREVICIDKNRALSDAYKLMEKKNISRILVTSAGELCGIMSIKDVLEHLGSSKHGKILPSSLHVSTVMNDSLIVIKKGKSVRDAAKLMLENRISCLPVMDADRVVGIITKTDLIKSLKNSKKKIEKVITWDPDVVSPKDRVVHARRIMLDKNIGRLIVLEEDELVGIVTEKDIAKALSAFRKTADRYQYSRIRNMIIEDVMTQTVKTLDINATVGDAVSMMLENNFSGIPILNDGKLAGIVTKTDLIRVI